MVGYREQLEKKIEAKRREIVAAEGHIRKAQTYIAAWEEALRMLPQESSGPAPALEAETEADPDSIPAATAPSIPTAGSAGPSRSGTPPRPGSDLAKAREAILAAKQPLYIGPLLIAMGKEDTKAARANLVGSISDRCKNADTFVRTAPNTFGLLELGHRQMMKKPTTEELLN